MADRPAQRTIRGRVLLAGSARGTALVLEQPLSFWGGLDPGSGTIVEQRHPQHGEVVRSRILVMASGRGSSSSSSVLAEALRSGTGPAAILLRDPDEIVLVGALVVQLLDGRATPVVHLDERAYASLVTGDTVAVADDGTVSIWKTSA